ncbi:hypothetical protein ACIO3O_09300 [Streptomyces sp. NPDC087440]|uniref:hypothetical protein n=1 Tax=Streptomyces sp. NPDC087440 TaxID=3365790 RepID=UPI003820C3B1
MRPTRVRPLLAEIIPTTAPLPSRNAAAPLKPPVSSWPYDDQDFTCVHWPAINCRDVVRSSLSTPSLS